ncbi:MAG: hypothetical protein OXH72_12700 [Caldilineaceae bacterium]|nr:hypothetical protein [Caldilineaceae bacterium]
MRLDEAFSDSGFFWLPEDKDQSCQVPGTLSVSEAGRVTLETFGYWSKDPLSLANGVAFFSDSKLTRIFGYTPELGNVTLAGAVVTQNSIPSRTDGWVFNRSSFVANSLLTGGHFNEGEPLFDRLTCRIEGLHEWLGVSGSTTEMDKTAYPHLPFQASDAVKGEFGIRPTWSLVDTSDTFRDLNTYDAYVKISTSKAWNVNNMLQRAYCMRDFVALGTGSPVAITGLVGWLPADGQEHSIEDFTQNRVGIFCESKQQSSKSNTKLLPQFMTFTHKDIGSRSIKKWFDLCLDGRSTGGQAVELFCDVLYGDDILPADIRMFKAAESLKLMYALSLKNVEYKRIDLYDAVKCLASKSSGILEIRGDEEEFAGRVTATRNLWVHRKSDDRPERRAQECEGVDLYWLLKRCEALLFCCLTAHVLGSKEEAIRVLRDAKPIKDRVRSA